MELIIVIKLTLTKQGHIKIIKPNAHPCLNKPRPIQMARPVPITAKHPEIQAQRQFLIIVSGSGITSMRVPSCQTTCKSSQLEKYHTKWATDGQY